MFVFIFYCTRNKNQLNQSIILNDVLLGMRIQYTRYTYSRRSARAFSAYTMLNNNTKNKNQNEVKRVRYAHKTFVFNVEPIEWSQNMYVCIFFHPPTTNCKQKSTRDWLLLAWLPYLRFFFFCYFVETSLERPSLVVVTHWNWRLRVLAKYFNISSVFLKHWHSENRVCARC